MALLPLAAGALVTLSACADEGTGSSSVTVWDSAGVRIVESSEPAWGAGEEWRIEAKPDVEIGGAGAPGYAVLDNVTGVSVLPDGRIALSNMGDNTIRLYSRDGDLLWKAGGSGNGPGEFRQVRRLVRRGDELWGLQPLPHPVQVFDTSGRFLRSFPMPTKGDLLGPWVEGVFADGTLLAQGPARGEPEGAIGIRTTEVMRISTASVVTLATLPADVAVRIPGFSTEVQALGPHLCVAASGDHFYEGFPSRWEIVERDGRGAVVRRFRRPWKPAPVTPEDRIAYRDALLDAGRVMGLLDPYRKLADGMIYPQHHAAFSRIIVDGTGAVWVARSQTDPPWNEDIDYVPVPPRPIAWDVFDADGAWLGTVETPTRFRVMEIGGDYVAGVVKDSLDVQSVRVYALDR